MFLYIFAIFVIFLSHFLWKNRYLFNTDFNKDFDEGASIPLMKNGIPFTMMSPEQIFLEPRKFAKKFKRSVRARLFHIDSFCIIRARDAEKILGSSSKHLTKGFVYNFLHPFIKTGLLTSDGDKWHQRRRMLTPAFHFNILKEFAEIFREEADQLVVDLKKTGGKVVDMIPISTQFTLNTVCESAMGIKLSNLGNNGVVYRNNIYSIGKAMIKRSMRPWLHIDFIYSLLGYKKQFDEILGPVHHFTQTIIDKRRKEFITKNSGTKNDEPKDESDNIYMGGKKKRAAMMDTLLQAQSQGLIDDEGIIEETDTFTFEGHDTTSSGMTFTLLLLAHHPEVQEKIFQEIQDVTGGRDELTTDDLNKMNYMERALKESLRIYPPVPYIARKLTEDMLHDGHLFKKGTTMEIFIYDIHRDPEVFPDPEKFDPDRFLPENSEGRSNFAFIAFSAGMRNCIGQRFAMLELKVMLTKVIQNFKILPVTKREDLVFMADLVLRTNHPVKMRFEPR
uniref:cytochrome P450 4C1-like n=1 Tax=Chironomus tepperi TaxID=113505 RepID=UPI003B834D28